MTKVAFVTTFCPHHRRKTFELLNSYCTIHYYFFSPGDEWYWQKEHGVHRGSFSHDYLGGFRIGRTRITPSLPIRLWRDDYDVVVKCINGRFALPITYLVARLKRKPFVLWTGVWTRLRTPFHQLLFPLVRYIYRHADAIVVYGDHVKRYLRSEGVEAERIVIAPHAVDNDEYRQTISQQTRRALLQQLCIPEHSKVVLYLGRLEDGKGLEYLVEAFSLVKDRSAILVFAGSGSKKTLLERMVHKRAIEAQVRFAGHVPTDGTVPYYASAKVVVLPSVTTHTFKEPWGLVVNEAFNQGVPVIASAAVGAAAGGLVQHEQTGLVVPEADSGALARAIQRVLADPKLHARLGAQAMTVIGDWDNGRMVAGFREAIALATTSKRG